MIVEDIAVYTGKAFGLLWNLLVKEFYPPWGSLVFLLALIFVSYFLVKSMLLNRKGLWYLAAILGILFWLLVILGGVSS